MSTQRAKVEPSGQAFAWMLHSRKLVSFGVEPAPVPNGLIQAIRRQVDQINGEQVHGLKPGETVVIQDDPFAGQEPFLTPASLVNEHVRVLLKLLRGRYADRTYACCAAVKNNVLDCSGKGKPVRCGHDRLPSSTLIHNVERADAGKRGDGSREVIKLVGREHDFNCWIRISRVKFIPRTTRNL